MTWLLMAWLCTVAGNCRPVQTPYPSRSACLRAERALKQAPGLIVTPHCHHVPAPTS